MPSSQQALNAGIMSTDVQFERGEACTCGADTMAFITPTQEHVMPNSETVIWGYVR
jgi:hypothetical protein